MENNSKTAPIMQEKEQNQVSLDLMHRMRLTGMAAAFEESLTSTYAEAMKDIEKGRADVILEMPSFPGSWQGNGTTAHQQP